MEPFGGKRNFEYVEVSMAAKGIKETEKVTVGAIRTALQTWLAPQLTDISQRLTHVEARLALTIDLMAWIGGLMVSTIDLMVSTNGWRRCRRIWSNNCAA